MTYSSKPIQDGRYGIFINNELAATAKSFQESEKIVKALREKANQIKKLGKVR